MSVIIRLQELPWSASALDIRNFFRGLVIPQGGVHIIGGERGDAFIAFSSDEDARQGMMRNMACLNGVPIQLFLSSKSEMQGVIDEARSRDLGIAMAPARVMPPAPSTGIGQDYQNQPYPGSHDQNHQQLPQQTDYQRANDPNQSQFPGMQNVDKGQNQMQGQLHGQQMPDRANQYNFNDDRRQEGFQQNAPTGSQDRNNENQNYWKTGNYGTRMEGGYEGKDGSQWYSQGPDFGTKQPYYGGGQQSQGQGPSYQRDYHPGGYDPNQGGQDKQFPQHQGREQPYNPNSSWQEEYGSDSRQPFTKTDEQPGPHDMNRRGILPHPPVPGQTNEPARKPESGSHLPHHPGPVDPMRFSAVGRHDMEQWPDVNKDQGRTRGRPDEEYGLQTMEQNRFPPSRREDGPAKAGPRQGAFPERGAPKRGILPTPDMANQDNNEELYNPEDVEQGHWPDYTGEESRGYEHGRGRGQFHGGRESEMSDAPVGRGRSFDGPERPRDRPRRSRFDQSDERSKERGLDGRPFERSITGGLMDNYQDKGSAERGPDRRPLSEREHAQERGSDGRPFRRGQDGQSFERGHDEWPHERVSDRRKPSRFSGGESDSRPFDRAQDRRPLERVPGGPSADRDLTGMSLDRSEDRESMERGHERRPFKRGPDGRQKEGGLLGRAPDTRPFPGGPEGQVSGGHEENFDRGRSEPGRQFDGPPGNRFPQTEEYEPMDIGFDPQAHGDPGMRGSQGRGFPGVRDFDGHSRERGGRSGRGHDRWDEGTRGGRGFNRESGRGRGFHSFDQQEEKGFVQYPVKERYDEGRFEDMGTDEMYSFRDGDFDPGQQGGRGRGGPRHPARIVRGHGRPEDSRDMNFDRRQMGRGREDMDSNMRDRHRVNPDEIRATKGLLGDAPVGFLPTPTVSKFQDDSKSALYKNDDLQRDRDRRNLRNREERETSKDDRSSRRGDYHPSRDRSPSRDHHQRRNERDRDRIEHRDRSSYRDSKDTGLHGTEKSPGKSDKKSDEQKPKSKDSSQKSESRYIHAKGFPVAYSVKEIQRFFFGCDLLYSGIKIIQNARGQNTGEVFLQFPAENQAKKAIEKNGETIFGSPITLIFTTKQDFEEKTVAKTSALSTEREKTSSVSPAVNDKEGFHIVVIKGLPPNIKREDLVNFFSAVKLASHGNPVVIEYDERKQATGVAYIITASLKDFETAMGYDGHMFGSKALQLSAGQQKDIDECIAKQEEINKKFELSKAQLDKPSTGLGVMGARPPLMGVAPGIPVRQPLYGQKPPINVTPEPPRNGPAFEPNKNPPRQHPGEKPPKSIGPGFCVQIQGLPMLATYNEIRAFFSELNIVSHRGVQIVHDGNGKPTGEAFVEFVTQEDKDKALKKDKTSFGRQIVAVKSVAKPDMIERLRNARLSGVAPGHGPSNPPHFPPRRAEPPSGGPFMTIPSHLLNPRWFYLSCQNFPHGISLPEIVDFFREYNPIPESIRQLYEDDGTSSGNAVVGFFTREDVSLALEDLNGTLYRQSLVVLQPIK